MKRKLVNDLTGQRFGRLMVLGVDDKPSRKTYFICQCDCGNVKSVRADALMSGATKSCGCLKAEQDKRNLNQTKCKKKFAEFGAKVGGTRLYSIWQGMKSRCYNDARVVFARYSRAENITLDELFRTIPR